MNVNLEREQSLSWWKNLPIKTQDELFESYKQIEFSPAKSSSQLTGREIHSIWTKLHPKTTL